MTTFTPPPDAPLRTDKSPTFISKAFAFIGWFTTHVNELIAFAASLSLVSTTDTSATSNAISTGSKSFTVSTGKSFSPGMYLVIADTAAPSTNSMSVQVTSYSGTSLVVNSLAFTGSGTKTAWTISQSASFTPLDNSVATAKLQDNAVTSAKILDANVTTAKLADDATTAAKLADSALGQGLINGKIVASVNASALTVAVKNLAGNDPSASDPVLAVFRSGTVTDGTYVVVSITAATSLTVSIGSTLGTVASILANLAILIINNAGTAELAIANLAGGVNLDGTGVLSTTAEGGAGAADSANVVYSTTARSNVAYRPVALMEITETTPGTWAAAHTKLTPVANPQTLMQLGFGQTWQAVTRTVGTTYYNTTGKPIVLSLTCILPNTGTLIINITQNGVTTTAFIATNGNTGSQQFTGVVTIPPGASYVSAGNTATNSASELR